MSGVAFAGKMENAIQEAIYMFEMEGKTFESIALLTKVSTDGDAEDRESAFFYLGKIQELLGRESSSNFYYKQSLSLTNDVSKSYWLAERDAATGAQEEAFLKSPITLRNRIQKVFGKSPTYCLFHDGAIGKIANDKIVYIPTNLAEPAQIIHISQHGFWYQIENMDSLFFQPFLSSRPKNSFASGKVNDLLVRDNQALVQTEHQLMIINKKGIQTSIAEKYNGCTLEGFYAPSGEYILNCPDNALHFISEESGTESRIIAQFDVIQKVLANRDYLTLFSNGYLYCYIPKRSITPIWKVPAHDVETMFSFGNDIAILEASGRVSLINQVSGFLHATIRSDATGMYPLAQGTIGLFSDEGAITALDTLLYPLWNFNFTVPITMAPIHTDGNIYLYFGNNRLQPIISKFYGKKTLRSEKLARKASQLLNSDQKDSLNKILDTLFKLEPGNAEGWFIKALSLENEKGREGEKKRAWSEAVRLSASNPHVTDLVLTRYGKSIGAKFISMLPISPKTRYPQLFGNKKDLFTLDPAANRLFCINTENGELRWSRNVGKQDNNPIVGNDDKYFVIASGYKVSLFDLTRDTPPATVQLPGKAFEVKVYDNSTYISTWNGFLLKIQGNKLTWSKKIYSSPFMILKSEGSLYTCNLDGDFNSLREVSGDIDEGKSRKIQGTVSHIVKADSIIAIATTGNNIFLFNPNKREQQETQVITEAPIASLQGISFESKEYLLIGLADQSIMLYSKQGAPIWKYKGQSSIFTSPFVREGEAWIDQGNEIISLSLKDGKITRRFSTPGGAGTPFIMNHTLFSASPKRILYGFSL